MSEPKKSAAAAAAPTTTTTTVESEASLPIRSLLKAVSAKNLLPSSVAAPYY